MQIHAVCFCLHHSMPRCIKAFLCCHGNLLPFTFTIVTCIFALVHLSVAVRMPFTITDLRPEKWSFYFNVQQQFFMTSYSIKKLTVWPFLHVLFNNEKPNKLSISWKLVKQNCFTFWLLLSIGMCSCEGKKNLWKNKLSGVSVQVKLFEKCFVERLWKVNVLLVMYNISSVKTFMQT